MGRTPKIKGLSYIIELSRGVWLYDKGEWGMDCNKAKVFKSRKAAVALLTDSRQASVEKWHQAVLRTTIKKEGTIRENE